MADIMIHWVRFVRKSKHNDHDKPNLTLSNQSSLGQGPSAGERNLSGGIKPNKFNQVI